MIVFISQQQQEDEEAGEKIGKSRQNLKRDTKFRLFGDDLSDDVNDVTSQHPVRHIKTTSASKPRG